jgi:phosphatidylglycerol:prolipoprotein diacylglycerol transferase
MLPTLQVGPLAVPVPALLVLLGIWLGLSLAERAAPRYGVDPNHLYNLVLIALVGGLVGARLAYALRYPALFAGRPLDLLSRDLALLDPLGGVAIALIAALVYAQRRQMPFWSTLDALTPGLAVMGVGLGLSHLASGSAFGSPSNLPWAIELWGAPRHPVQVYETILAALILVAVWPAKGWIRPTRPGMLFLSFTALSALSRLFLEAFRGDSTLWFDGLRSAQIIAWLVLAASLWLLLRRRTIQTTE